MERSGLLESKVLRIEVLTREVYRVDDFISFRSLGHGSLDGGSLGALSESVLLLSFDSSQVSHSAGALSVSPLGLAGPVVSSGLGGGATTGASASLLLLVPVLLAAESAERVRLVVSSSLSRSSPTHYCFCSS